jgi:hypothetical protein
MLFKCKYNVYPLILKSTFKKAKIHWQSLPQFRIYNLKLTEILSAYWLIELQIPPLFSSFLVL